MPLQKIVLKPGINREGTTYSNEGGYWDCDKVRFRSGYPEKIGGCVEYSSLEFWGACYSMLAYTSVDGRALLGFGTHLKAYVEFGSYFYDITPIRSTATLASNAFTTNTATPTIIVVNHTSHGAITGDFVTISGVASDVNGVPIAELNAEHQITYLTANTYSIAITTAPTSSGTTGACDVEYQITTGLPYYVTGTGWGTGTWGRGTWGSSGTAVSTGDLQIWGISNYGEALIYGPRGGGLYFWDFADGVGPGTRGSLVSGIVGANAVPTSQTGILVTDQRFVVVIGSNDFGGTDPVPLLVRWSDQEDYLEWEPMATTQAGSYPLSVGSYAVTLKSSKQEVLVWTDTALYSMQFVGAPLVYGFTLLSSNLSIAGPNAAIVVNGVAYWMGKDKFFIYDGQVRPLPCTVRTYIFEDLDPDFAWQVVAGTNEGYNEVWWLYVSTEASVLADKYVIYNYVENVWSYGSMDRTFWYDSALKTSPISSAYNSSTQKSKLYYQEVGCDDGTSDPATAIEAYVESSDFDIGDGHNFGFVSRIIPDLTFEGSTAGSPSVTMTVSPRRFSGSNYGSADTPTVTRTSTATVEQYTEQVFVRVRGRQMKYKISSTGTGVKWQMGAPRIDIRPDGRK